MIKQITDQVYFGDKPSVVDSLGQFQTVINVAHHLRRPYWSDLGKLDWSVWYYRMALPDREPVTDEYMFAFERILDGIKTANKTPILCHCRMGGHRGPTAGFFSAFYLGGCSNLSVWLEKMELLCPGFNKETRGRVYRKTLIDYCKRKYS